MVKIELTERDAAVLIETLESCLAELKTERVGTDNRVFHASLLERENFVAELIRRLQGEVAPGAA